VIHAFTYHSGLPAVRVGRRIGVPVVFGILALFGPEWRHMRGPVLGHAFQAFEAYLMRLRVQRRLFLSDASLELARSLGLARADDEVIAPGISLEDYAPSPQKDGVLFAGNLDSRKGTRAVLQAAAALPDVPFKILGWGPDYDAIDRAKPSNVDLQPFEDRKQLAAALGRARIFVLPSKVETFGLAVAEAMASGCAIVSSAPLPFEGERVPAGDAAATTAAIARLWNARQRCHACGTRNLALAQEYSWPRHMARLELVYREVLQEHRRDRRRHAQRDADQASDVLPS
jgi:glycosyltransferase involved in cell wall biosynthesis